jgi:hypothetical protein
VELAVDAVTNELAVLDNAAWLDSLLASGGLLFCVGAEPAPVPSVPAAPPPQADNTTVIAMRQMESLMSLNAKGRMGLLPKKFDWLFDWLQAPCYVSFSI